MKKIILTLVCAICFLGAEAQYKFPALDASPADFVIYPLKAANTGAPAKIKVSYSRPAKKGREIFGTLEAFGKVWRAGANESTQIQFYVPVTVGGKSIAAGTYSLFAIPDKDKWTIILNSATNRWGAYSYDQTKDIARVDVPVKTLPDVVENFSITFTDKPGGANLVMGWDKTAVELPITFQ
ncbi:MAG: asparagine synthetase [Sphingobacteriaceae bacterium]|jgi:hypothetical protein|nr:asparagine synthetase [Sphingobacteriaceae bacterium]